MGCAGSGQVPVIKNPEQDYLSLKVDVLGVDPYKIAKDESINVILSRKDSSTQMLSVPHMSGIEIWSDGAGVFRYGKGVLYVQCQSWRWPIRLR